VNKQPSNAITDSLTIEQQFNLECFKQTVNKMDREAAQSLLVELYTKMIHQENQYKDLVKEQWGF
jgi:uncharacterized protein YaaW (UPF0174 family)